jgi:hypothetical protein
MALLLSAAVRWSDCRAAPLSGPEASRQHRSVEFSPNGRTRRRTAAEGSWSALTWPSRGHSDIHVIGDLAVKKDRDGKPLPGVAQVAMQQWTYAARAILKRIRGESGTKPFQYFDKGTLAVIGRAAAVANVFGARLSGLPAWLVWV